MSVRTVFAILLATALLSFAATRHTTGTGSALLQRRSLNASKRTRVSPHLPAVTAGLDGFATLLRNALAATERLQRQASAVALASGGGDAPLRVRCRGMTSSDGASPNYGHLASAAAAHPEHKQISSCNCRR